MSVHMFRALSSSLLRLPTVIVFVIELNLNDIPLWIKDVMNVYNSCTPGLNTVDLLFSQNIIDIYFFVTIF